MESIEVRKLRRHADLLANMFEEAFTELEFFRVKHPQHAAKLDELIRDAAAKLGKP